MAPSPSPSYAQFKHFITTFPIPGVALLAINRPQKLNAFTPQTWSELPPLFSLLSSDPSVLAIILTGSGSRAFTSGLDVNEAFANSPLAYMLSPPRPPSPPQNSNNSESTENTAPTDPARVAHELRKFILHAQECLTSVATCPKPVIIAIHGLCFGLGIDLACCGDIRLCSPSAVFAVKEVDIGLAADLGTLTRLPKVVGCASWVKDVCLTGRTWGGKEAEGRGFVSEVSPDVVDEVMGGRGRGGEREKEALVRRAVEIAGLIAEKSPVAVQGTKELLDWSVGRSVEEGLRYTAAWNAGMVQTKDVVEAVMAGREKRKGRFSKL